jgi:hypothetical protein
MKEKQITACFFPVSLAYFGAFPDGRRRRRRRRRRRDNFELTQTIQNL